MTERFLVGMNRRFPRKVWKRNRTANLQKY
ncbi:hypothetical protein DSL72_006211 [Monilinia vaccinii-corymbosi]|uniref:Uncharacterized protein n=1 Tax=Monilinia vaccinii-corymbosi TaxID=61207 RepID=A0A8A3PH36_9HELO|nr:hypothetical protein DSL72_006211 [Monilinia vaccinii-corymbosi]